MKMSPYLAGTNASDRAGCNAVLSCQRNEETASGVWRSADIADKRGSQAGHAVSFTAQVALVPPVIGVQPDPRGVLGIAVRSGVFQVGYAVVCFDAINVVDPQSWRSWTEKGDCYQHVYVDAVANLLFPQRRVGVHGRGARSFEDAPGIRAGRFQVAPDSAKARNRVVPLESGGIAPFLGGILIKHRDSLPGASPWMFAPSHGHLSAVIIPDVGH